MRTDKEPFWEHKVWGWESDEEDEGEPSWAQECQPAHHGGLPVRAGEAWVKAHLGFCLQKPPCICDLTAAKASCGFHGSTFYPWTWAYSAFFAAAVLLLSVSISLTFSLYSSILLSCLVQSFIISALVLYFSGPFVSTWVKYYCTYHRDPKKFAMVVFDPKSGGKMVSVSLTNQGSCPHFKPQAIICYVINQHKVALHFEA